MLAWSGISANRIKPCFHVLARFHPTTACRAQHHSLIRILFHGRHDTATEDRGENPNTGVLTAVNPHRVSECAPSKFASGWVRCYKCSSVSRTGVSSRRPTMYPSVRVATGVFAAVVLSLGMAEARAA